MKDADIAAGSLIVTDLRRQFVDFTEPFLSLRSSALIRKHFSPSLSSNSRRPPATTPPPPPPTIIRSAADLLASELTYGVVRGSEVERSMSTSRDAVTRALWSRIATFWPPAFVDSVQEGVERARREPYAFIVDSPIAAYVAGRRPCQLYVTEPFLDQMTYAFAVRRGATRLRVALDGALRRARFAGEMQAMYLRWWRDECNAVPADQHIPPPIAADVGGGKFGRHASGVEDSSRLNDASSYSRTTSRCLCLTVVVVTMRTLFEFVHSSSALR